MCLRRGMLLRRLLLLMLLGRRMGRRVGLRLVLVVLRLGTFRLRVQSLRTILHRGLRPLRLLLGGTLLVSTRIPELVWGWAM